MLFNTYLFWLFFAVVVTAYWRLPHRLQNLLLLAASYVFYAAWDWRFAFLLLASTGINYLAGFALDGQASRRGTTVLSLAVAANLSLLAVFKYATFITVQANVALGLTGIMPIIPVPHILLPIGISFFTFQGLAYVIDVYWGRIACVKNFWEFALFKSFFPQLVAGPIERASHLVSQIRQPRRWQPEALGDGFHHVCLGLLKKVVIADNMAAIVNAVFSKPPGELNAGEVLVGVYAFAFQIYGDFSGYSSIARGISCWLGFNLTENFNAPYFASSPREFWRRWHITLSQWLRDYLYIPLGGNRAGLARTLRNVLVTMALGGLWHGANWTFVAWGLYHGLLQSFERVLAAAHLRLPSPGVRGTAVIRALSIILTFHLTCLGWLFFRAESFGQAWGMLGRLLADANVSAPAVGAAGLVLFYCTPLLVFEAFGGHRDRGSRPWRQWLTLGFYAYALAMLVFFPSPTQHEFIYFQF